MQVCMYAVGQNFKNEKLGESYYLGPFPPIGFRGGGSRGIIRRVKTFHMSFLDGGGDRISVGGGLKNLGMGGQALKGGGSPPYWRALNKK